MKHPDLDRRHFLAEAAAASLIAAHATGSDAAGKSAATGPRIVGLELLCATPLADVKAFYQDKLGLRVVAETKDRLTVAAGETRLTFARSDDAGRPFYHFAFNIPENKLMPARDWLKKRAKLLPVPAHLRDADFPSDVVHFRHWNAHSLFFLDPAGNVAELIARHDLKNGAKGDFTSKDIHYASEIALVVDDVTATAAKLQEAAGVGQYKGGDGQFTALGDERGLLLVMKRGRQLALAAEERKAAEVFRAGVRLRGGKRETYEIPKFPYRITFEEPPAEGKTGGSL